MLTGSETQSLHLARIQAENFMRLRALDVQLGGNHLMLSGPNGSGKTTILDLIWTSLGGKAAKDLPEPIRKGEHKATSRLELAGEDGVIELIVSRVWTEKDTKLTVTAADGSPLRRPQEMLDRLFDQHTIDPSAFLKAKPQEQVLEVLSLVGVKPPVDQVRELLGEDVQARAGESAAAFLDRLVEEGGLLHHRRRDAGRVLQQKAAAHEDAVKRLASLPEGEAVSTDSLIKQRSELQQVADGLQAVRMHARDLRQKEEAAKVRLSGYQTERDRLQADMDMIRSRIGELDGRLEKGREIIASLAREAKDSEDALAGKPDPSPRLAEIERQIADHERRAAGLVARKQAEQDAARLNAERQQAAETHERLDGAVKSIKRLRAGLLDGAKLPVSGLEVGDGELRLNGVSFRQASHAERLRVACALACLRKPQLKILRLDDAEHLDKDSQQAVLRLAEEHGFRCMLAFVADTTDLTIELVQAKEVCDV